MTKLLQQDGEWVKYGLDSQNWVERLLLGMNCRKYWDELSDILLKSDKNN